MLAEHELKTFEQKLNAEKAEIEEQLSHIEEGIDFGNEVDSLEEEADESEERANRIGVKNALLKRREQVEAALKKIGAKIYGVCESCGGEISKDLLAVNPESTLCKNCKRERSR